jgi:hypothetical protein
MPGGIISGMAQEKAGPPSSEFIVESDSYQMYYLIHYKININTYKQN